MIIYGNTYIYITHYLQHHQQHFHLSCRLYQALVQCDKIGPGSQADTGTPKQPAAEGLQNRVRCFQFGKPWNFPWIHRLFPQSGHGFFLVFHESFTWCVLSKFLRFAKDWANATASTAELSCPQPSIGFDGGCSRFPYASVWWWLRMQIQHNTKMILLEILCQWDKIIWIISFDVE